MISEDGDLVHWFDCSDHMREPSDIAISGESPLFRSPKPRSLDSNVFMLPTQVPISMYAISKDIVWPYSVKTVHSNTVLVMRKSHAFPMELIYQTLVISLLVIRMVIDSMWPAFHVTASYNQNSNVLMSR